MPKESERNAEFKSIEKIGKKRNGLEAGYQLLKTGVVKHSVMFAIVALIRS